MNMNLSSNEFIISTTNNETETKNIIGEYYSVDFNYKDSQNIENIIDFELENYFELIYNTNYNENIQDYNSSKRLFFKACINKLQIKYSYCFFEILIYDKFSNQSHNISAFCHCKTCGYNNVTNFDYNKSNDNVTIIEVFPSLKKKYTFEVKNIFNYNNFLKNQIYNLEFKKNNNLNIYPTNSDFINRKITFIRHYIEPNIVIKKKKIDKISEDDIYDIITGEILNDPVRLESNGIIINEIINRTTAMKLNECPFTKSKNFKIIDANDIKLQIEKFKVENKQQFDTIQKDMERELHARDKFIEEEANNFILYITDCYKKAHNSKFLKYISYSIDDENKNGNGIDNDIVNKINNILYNEPVHIVNEKYLDTKIESGADSKPDTLWFILTCKCESCIAQNLINYQ